MDPREINYALRFVQHQDVVSNDGTLRAVMQSKLGDGSRLYLVVLSYPKGTDPRLIAPETLKVYEAWVSRYIDPLSHPVS